MKNVVFGILTFLFAVNLNAQIHDPVSFTTTVEKISDSDFYLVVTANIDKGWHLYSQNVPEDGPIATAFNFKSDSNEFQLVGQTAEGKGHTSFDKTFGMEIKYFENTATFKQHIRLLTSNKIDIVGEIEYMVCDDTQCLPPTYKDLNFSVQGAAGALLSVAEIEKISQEKKTSVEKKSEVKTEAKSKKEKKSKEDKKGLWTLFILSFFAGFAALLTPCVFPMIPMTVSFFTKQSKNKVVGIRNAIIFGLSIIVLYVLLGVVVTKIFGADSLNALATNVWFNLIFFALLIVFAVSFLGAFEITLPSSWGTKVDNQADKGGMIGIFFMALALAIVSFSCTGPIVGTALVAAAAQGGIAPIISMFGFSLAIALPFTLFAAFPGWLNSLPKSGGWLNTVKVVLGFLELALAFKFLSNADLVLELHWLEREVFIAIWIAVFGALALYLFGKIQLPHDSPLTHISVGRLGLGLVVMSFTIYMIPGLWGAPLNLISAFPPPQHYAESPYGVGYAKLGGGRTSHADIPEGAHLLAPHDILSFDDYETGLAYAKKVNKPVMIDFTGKACVNCRKMEQNVWPKDKVLSILKNDVILISLFVDDKRPLDEGDVVDSKLNPGKKLRYIGQKWSELQAIKYGTNAQPYYVLMDHSEENLLDPVGYTPDVDEYLEWLNEGLANFEKH
ncbi:MAG: cytochrome c biogenesis protein CcdA [Urechidicola sp.]|nr:cytochrome c biogenesis protein CcdA [Urechidicola sp.]